jgi:hypothetical protein
MSNLNNQLQSALDSGNYNSMAKAAKQAKLFDGVAPTKDKLAEMIDKYLLDNVDLSDTDTVEDTSGVDNAPIPTGKIGNECEYHYFPEFNVYAQNRGGQPIEPKFTPEVWEMVKVGLPGVEAIKTNIVKKMEKMAEAVKYQYTVTVTLNRTITFESIDAELGATDLAMLTVNQLLEENGQEPLTVNDYGFNVVKGKVKGQSNRSTSGGSSDLYAATDKDGLKPLSVRLKAQLKDMMEPNGLSLSDYAKHAYPNQKGLTDSLINFKRKGYLGAVSQANGACHFDPGAMYDGYELAHSLENGL